MMWSKLQKQLYNIMDMDSKFQMHCSVYKTKSAWTAGRNKYGLSKGREAIPRYWITVGKEKEIVWDFPNDFLDYESQVKGPVFWKSGEVSNIPTIREICIYSDNYTWIAETIREYIDTPRNQLLTKNFEKDKYGLIDVLRKYDRRIGKATRDNIQLNKILKEQEDTELLYEMATIGSNENIKLKQVLVNPSDGNEVYFKVLLSTKNGDRMGRFGILKPKLIIHRKDSRGYKPLAQNELTNTIIKNIHKFMAENHKDYHNYTNWEVTKYLWNLETNTIPYNTSLKEYMSGKFDNDTEINKNHRFVPTTQEIPSSWK